MVTPRSIPMTSPVTGGAPEELQVHSTTDVVSYRDIRIKEL